MHSGREYREPRPIDREVAKSILDGSDATQICDALIALAFYDPDMSWVQSICMRFAEQHPSLAVRQLSITCLGHLARIHRDKAILSAKPLLQSLVLNDPEVAGYASDALDDIHTFVERSAVNGNGS